LFGLYRRELAGFSLWGLLVAAVFVDIAVAISACAEKRIASTARLLWISVCVGVLCIGLILVDPTSNPKAASEIGQIIGFPMSVLTMPLGVIGSVLASKLPLIRPQDFYLGNIFDWMIFFIWGYLQWFFLLPYIFQKTRKNLVSKTEGKTS
jgi:hypothetical protein